MIRGDFNKRAVSREQIFYAVITFAVILVVGYSIVQADLGKYLWFFPDYGDTSEDDPVEDETKTLQWDEDCCCLYDGTKNIGECYVVEFGYEEDCKDKLEENSEGHWVNVEKYFCTSEKICEYGKDDDLDGKIDCEDTDCNGKFCGDEKICVNKECKDISVDEYSDYIFYIKIDSKDVTAEEVISLSAGTEYKISFGYKVEGEKADGIKSYYLRINDELGREVKGEREDPLYTGNSDDEDFDWIAEPGTFTFRAAFSKEKYFYSENIVKIIEKEVVVK